MSFGGTRAPVTFACGSAQQFFAPKFALAQVFKPNIQEANRGIDKGLILVADNGFIDDYHRRKGQPSIRLQLVEDLRPTDAAHRPRPDVFGAAQTRAPLLCYHGGRPRQSRPRSYVF